jgi:hypothetical protein
MKMTYIAFRIEGANRLLTVVAALDSGAELEMRFPWATWYHELAPYGEFRKAPGDCFRLEIPDTVANELIDLIMHGRPLPATFVEQLLIEK